jgi:hypothetical protein
MIHGTMAPVSGSPAPMLFHVGNAMVGPMDSRVPLQGINMMGMAKGISNGARAEIEIVGISGVTPSGEAFSLQCTGYVIGPDTMVGVKGILRDIPEGYFKKILPANFLSAGAAAFANSTMQTTESMNGQQFSNIKPGQEVKNAMLTGLSQTVTEATDVLNKRLRDWKSAVEISMGQEVVIVILDQVKVEAMSVDFGDQLQGGSASKSMLR